MANTQTTGKCTCNRLPLTDEWFRKTMRELYNIELKEGDYADDILLVRAVEAAHGIKGDT